MSENWSSPEINPSTISAAPTGSPIVSPTGSPPGTENAKRKRSGRAVVIVAAIALVVIGYITEEFSKHLYININSI